MNIHNLSMTTARLQLPTHRLLHSMLLTCLGALLFTPRVEAQSWEFNLTLTKESLCAVNSQSASVPISVSPGDEVIVQVKNNTSARQLLRWRGVIYQGEAEPTAGTQEVVSRRFYSLQKPIKAGETFIYHWKMEKRGTLVYNCHVILEQVI